MSLITSSDGYQDKSDVVDESAAPNHGTFADVSPFAGSEIIPQVAAMLPRFYERDMDILLAEEFQVSPGFANWFLGGVDCDVCTGGQVIGVEVSKSDILGESDLIVLFEATDSKRRFALFIEDKIDAPLQPQQLARYRKRADIGQQQGLYSHYHVVLASPESYPQTHVDAEGFDGYVSYESISNFLKENEPASKRLLYRASIFANSATKLGHAGWIKQTDEETDAFWQAAYNIAISEFPDLEMKSPKYAKGQTWLIFRPHEMPTMPRIIAVNLKADRGFADLTFSGILCRLFLPQIRELLDEGMTVHQAGKSTVIRLSIPSFGISAFTSTAEANVRAAFAASTKLIQFYRKHRYSLDVAASKSVPEPLPPQLG